MGEPAQRRCPKCGSLPCEDDSTEFICGSYLRLTGAHVQHPQCALFEMAFERGKLLAQQDHLRTINEVNGKLEAVKGALDEIESLASTMPRSFVSIADEFRAWSRATFGETFHYERLTNHIRKELCEIEADPQDLEEWIDVIIIAMDGASRSGASSAEIEEALMKKLAKNRARKWPDVSQLELGAPIEHVRTEDEVQDG